jgi:hypothetical protein
MSPAFREPDAKLVHELCIGGERDILGLHRRVNNHLACILQQRNLEGPQSE